ncbi:asparagine synthase (glutamine-hydrolyzing) [Kitasatospora cathayae]|uniref:asparagine synthase (glutamine-hydrolyzing) n=1 Tax=Kitasatospora cathayae TaxID=3004092 RepID=A0ABY7PXA9_9ACTN|nr:asparagine synthase (glutamine-hydrolyzing) [Kitasatospora sp. HUAS 3-15]WBP85082.1 asparagine synthase (glutamine-hydrolyzing) [Kitasatospora sp. HUAS 3-15]
MCRIFGRLGPAAVGEDLARVSDRQRHGGPDRRTVLSGGGWALGCNRLAVTDPEGGTQPYRLGREILVAFNGEIYNHDELRLRLLAHGYHVPDRCDGSVLPALYAEYGPGFVEQLDGMFAIAVLDLRAEPTLLLATDPLGMKPLYYHQDGGTLQFASELPALLAFPSVRGEVWGPGLDQYLRFRTPLGERTMYEHVRALPPAAVARFTVSGGLRIDRRPAPAATECPADEAAVGRRTLALLRQEVGRLARADVPVSVITSGGLDSGLVTALAREHLPELHAFTLVHRGDWPYDERRFAAEVARRSGAVHHEVELDPADLPELLPRTVAHLGQPNADPITVSTYLLFSAVRTAGFTVALTGDGADELFGGYDRIRTALDTPAGEPWTPAYLDQVAAVPQRMREWLYTTDYRALLADRADERGAELAGADRMAEIWRFETEQRMPAYHLRRVDHLSMASAVEVRLPYCQPSVRRFAQSLPEHFKVSHGRVKKPLYAAARGLLPEPVLRRPKQPFTLPVAAMLAPGQPVERFLRDVLNPDRLRRDGRLRADRVQALLDRQANVPDDTTARAVWALMIHQLWLNGSGRAAPAGP